jgi:vancomycin resistance protein VanW
LRRCVGNPTAARGDVPGMVLVHDQLRAGIGGDLCQLSNMLH